MSEDKDHGFGLILGDELEGGVGIIKVGCDPVKIAEMRDQTYVELHISLIMSTNELCGVVDEDV